MTDGMDNPEGTQDVGGQIVGEMTPTGQDAAKALDGMSADGQNFLLNYADKEAAEKGIKSSQSKITELAEQVKSLEAQASMEKRVQLMETLQQDAQRDRTSATQLEDDRRNSEYLERFPNGRIWPNS